MTGIETALLGATLASSTAGASTVGLIGTAGIATAGQTLATLGTIASVAGAGLGLIGSLRQSSTLKAAGRARQREAEYRAEQSRVAAGQERAKAQRRAAEEARQGRIQQSSVLAQSAAGGQASSENVLGIMSGLDYDADYRKSLALFEGETSAKNLEQSALLAEYEGEQESQAAKISASAAKMQGITDFATSIGGTLYSKYAPKTAKRQDIVNWRQGGSSVVGEY